jgi:hypothetical protein
MLISVLKAATFSYAAGDTTIQPRKQETETEADSKTADTQTCIHTREGRSQRAVHQGSF